MAVDMELEAVLRPPEFPQASYPPKVITLANGKKLVVREVTRADVPQLLKSVHPTMFIDRDYYNVVGARVYAELLAWQYYRVQNEYVIVGQIDGLVAGIVNGRLYSPKVGMSLHTLAIDRGLRIGAHLFAAKMEHHLEYLGQNEVWITAESPIGFRRWMIEYGLEPKEGMQHELGGASFYVLTKKIWQLARQEIKVADEDAILEKILGAKRRQAK